MIKEFHENAIGIQEILYGKIGLKRNMSLLTQIMPQNSWRGPENPGETRSWSDFVTQAYS
jgi:hypothetical protein